MLVDSLTWLPYCCTFGSCNVRELSKRCNLFCRIIYCKIVAFTVSKNWILQNISCVYQTRLCVRGATMGGVLPDCCSLISFAIAYDRYYSKNVMNIHAYVMFALITGSPWFTCVPKLFNHNFIRYYIFKCVLFPKSVDP